MTEGVWPDQPHFNARAMKCPHCGAIAEQTWVDLKYIEKVVTYTPYVMATCRACTEATLWHDVSETMLYPAGQGGPVAPEDLPEVVRPLYEEARSITNLSPRAASALLRLALESLLQHLYPSTDNLYAQIGAAKAAGLPDDVINAMDVLRVNGNDAIHEIDRNDTAETASALFGILNIVVDRLVTQPQRIAEMYSNLPESKRAQIAKRDSGS